eukprot:TRINITY_DN3109_c0_g1_i1.p1 TRINITY_DN3109_c0_g1~~TRINITY_DN3109_c0_g1_i1.p1  ORF type:complete len:211 (+),score=7.66 TRINITY_DN3109_c0_g1_i1:75-707(+)
MFAVVCKKATGEFRIKGGCVLLPKDTISQALSTEKRKKFEDNDISFLLITRYQYKKLVANHGGHLAHWDKDGNCRGAGCIIDCICMGDEYKELVLLVVKFANAVEPEEYFPLLDSAFDTITRKVDVVVAGRLCCGESLQVHGTCVISNKRPLVVLNTACPSQLIGSPIIAIIGHETRLIGIHCGVKGDCVGFSFGVRIRECIGKEYIGSN